ncbi:hypothetical protein E2C01_098226 [Portunus trituberculatus]|uniref:Uncharacterized protein n=1 Tax=Portunus trituberculatus TaxID=210409 RepID=A0A5B7K0Q0_PORTR|nr:hypothetical protein [Portunus trituberculatus]
MTLTTNNLPTPPMVKEAGVRVSLPKDAAAPGWLQSQGGTDWRVCVGLMMPPRETLGKVNGLVVVMVVVVEVVAIEEEKK